MLCRLTSRSSHAERDGEKRLLTEPAVDDFAARCGTIRKDAAGRARVVYVNQPVRRRQLSFGPLAGQSGIIQILFVILAEEVTNMTVQHIEKQLMKLDANSRAKLASKLLSSLDELSEEENEKLWAQEAFRRHEDLVQGKAKSRSADVALKSARAQLK